jgi:hypothetical protein
MRLQPIVMIKPLARCDYSHKKESKRVRPEWHGFKPRRGSGSDEEFRETQPAFW